MRDKKLYIGRLAKEDKHTQYDGQASFQDATLKTVLYCHYINSRLEQCDVKRTMGIAGTISIRHGLVQVSARDGRGRKHLGFLGIGWRAGRVRWVFI